MPWPSFPGIQSALPRLPTLFTTYNYTDEIILSVILIGVLLLIELVDEHRQFWETLSVRPIYVRWACTMP